MKIGSDYFDVTSVLEEIPYEEFWEMVEETKEPMPDGSPKWITHDDMDPPDPSFCWEKDGFAWTNRDFT